MASSSDFAQNYARKFIQATNKQNAIDEIVSEINGLVFEANQRPVDYATKTEIIEEIKKILSREIPLKYADGGKVLIVEQKDNQQFLNMVSYVLAQLKK